MKKYLFIYLSLIMAIISSSVYAENSEILYDNGRFDPLYQVAKSSLKDAEYTDATHKIFDYLDTVNFYPCNGYQLLIDLEKKINGNNGKIYQKIYDSCEFFSIGDYKDGFQTFDNIDITDHKNDLFSYSIFRFYEMFLPEIDNSGYKSLYSWKEDLDFLLKNKDYLISKFPITYGTRLAAIYYDNKETELFNSIYKDFLKKNDFLLKLIFEMYFYDLNGGEINQITNLFKYENLKRKNEDGTLYVEDVYMSIYKILFRESVKINNKELIIKYFFKKEGLYSKYRDLYTKNIIDFFIKIDDLSSYKEYIIENVALITYSKNDQTGSLMPIKDRAINYYNFVNSYHFLDRFTRDDYVTLSSIVESRELSFSLNNLLAHFYDIKNSKNSDYLADIKKTLITSIEKIFILNKDGKLIVTNDLSVAVGSVIQNIPELQNNSIKNLKIISLNEKSIFFGNFPYYFLFTMVLITLLLLMLFRKRG